MVNLLFSARRLLTKDLYALIFSQVCDFIKGQFLTIRFLKYRYII
jgi:hypothetical protein